MQVPVIPAKLSIPLLPASYMPRPRLDRRWQEWRGKKIVMVTAGAGFGKTSFLAANARACGQACIWYSLDEMDAELATFCAHLTHAVRSPQEERADERLHDAPRESMWATLPEPTGQVDPSDPTFTKQILAFLVQLLRERPAGTVLVLDDVHLVASSSEVLQFIERLIRFLPEGTTLILASREPVGISTMKLRSLGAVATVSATDLRFAEEEVELLFERRFPGVRLERRLARRIAAQTEGWAAGIEIFLQVLAGNPSRDLEAVLGQLSSMGTGWFAYFAEEVISRLDPEMQDFLRRSSILPRLDAGLCDEFLRRGNSREILEELCHRNLFTFPSGENGTSFRYHHLFRDFLRDQLRRTASEADFGKLHRRAARVLVKAGAWAEAAAAYAEAGDPDGALRLVEKVGEKLLATYQYTTVHRVFDGIPERMLRKHPNALFVLGRFRDIQGQWREAETIFRKVLRTCPPGEHRAKVLGQIALLKLRWGEYVACMGLCRRALSEPGPKNTRLRGRIQITLGVAACELGRLAEGERHLEQVGAICRKKRDIHGEGRISYLLAVNVYYPRGEFARAKEAARRALVIFRRLEDLRQVCRSLAVLAFVMGVAAEVREARALAAEGLRLAESLGYPYFEGYCHYTLGRCALIAGDLSRAREHFEATREIGEQNEEADLRLHSRMGLAELALVSGNPHAARRAAEEILEIARDTKDPLQEGQSCTLLGLADVGAHPARASAHWKRAETVFRRIGAAFELHRLLLLRLDSGDLCGEKRPGALAELLSGAARLEHDFLFLVLEPERSTGVLAEAFRLGIETDHAGRLLLCLGERAVRHLTDLVEDPADAVRRRVVDLLAQIGGDEARSALARAGDATTRTGRAALRAAEELERASGAPLKIRALGSLTVSVGERQLPRGRWRSARALRLFQFLLIHRFHWVPKDVILEALWPEADPEKAGNNLRQTIHVLRKVLEPGLKKTLYSQYVPFRNEACRLEPGKDHFYDVAEFEHHLQEAQALWGTGKRRQAEPLLRKAVELYRGDFLAESPYEDFAAAEREHLRDRLLRGVGRLLEHYAENRRWEDVIPLCRWALALDPYDEDTYWFLLRAHLKLRNRREALADYHRYEEMMIREMDLLPSRRMKALADEVIAFSEGGQRVEMDRGGNRRGGLLGAGDGA
jgi:ATP/maltotriose-dependent transcriptional regulator MalT/two-component SAPR family response regulator